MFFVSFLFKQFPLLLLGFDSRYTASYGVRLFRESGLCLLNFVGHVQILLARASMVLTCAHHMVMYNISVYIYIYMYMYNYSFIRYRIRIPILTSIFCAWGLTPVALRQIGETVRVIQCFRSDGTLLLGNDEVFFFSPDDWEQPIGYRKVCDNKSN